MGRKIEIPAQNGPVDGFQDGAKSITIDTDDVKEGISVAKKIFRKLFKKKEDNE
jgi:hypothetical protein